MGKRIFSKLDRDYIFAEIGQSDSIMVDDVAEIIRGMGVYDPVVAEELWYRDKARRILASKKDADGVRTMVAAGRSSGEFINLETCKSISKIDAALSQVIEKRDGMNAIIAKGMRRRAELEGQTSLFRDTVDKRTATGGNAVYA